MSFFRLPKDKKGYPFFKQNGKKIRAHSRVAQKKYGDIPKDFVVHHIDWDKSHSWASNLILLHRKDHNRIHFKKDLVICFKKNEKKISPQDL